MSIALYGIESVLDLQTGNEVMAHVFFDKPEHELFPYRKIQEEAYQGIREPRYVCYYCKQIIKIRGGFSDGGKVKMHFAHFKDSDECPVKTNNTYTRGEIDAMKYNGAKESRDHIETKNKIGELLELNEKDKKGVRNVIIDRILFSERISTLRRKPDVRCAYFDDRLVFEIQLSTTYISVIADREHFYKEEGAYLLWVFRDFHVNPNEQTFTEKDIYYANFQNVFVLDEEAINQSAEKNDLVLHCYYNQHTRQGGQFGQKWEDVFVTLSDLTFDIESRKVFYYNPDLRYQELQLAYQLELSVQEIKDKELQEEKKKRDEELQREINLKREQRENELEEFKRKEAEKKQQEIYKEKSKLAKEIRDRRKALLLSEAFKPQISVEVEDMSKAIFNSCLESMPGRTRLISIYLGSKTIASDVLELFKEGYVPDEKDIQFLTKQLEVAKRSSTFAMWRMHIEDLYVSIFYIVVKKLEFIEAYPKLSYLLSGLLSLKLHINVYPNPLALKDFVAELHLSYPEHTKLLNKAIDCFNAVDIPHGITEDHIQSQEYDWLFKSTFPELFT